MKKIDGSALVTGEQADQLRRRHALMLKYLETPVIAAMNLAYEKHGVQDHSVESLMLFATEELGEVASAIADGDATEAFNEIAQVVAVMTWLYSKIWSE